MMIPPIIIKIAVAHLPVIFSFKKNKERTGTKTYPNASNIGRSFTLTPCPKAITLMMTDRKNTL